MVTTTTFTGVQEYRSEAAAPLQAWPLMMMVGLQPLWFLLGLSAFTWIIFATPMAISLLQRRDLTVPKGFGWWLIFLVAAVGSVVSLDSASQLPFFGLRTLYYFSATIFLVYLVNGGEGVSLWRIIRVFTYLWMATIGGGYLAYILGDFSFQAPFGFFLPSFFSENLLIRTIITPGFADVQDFLGFPVPRSKAPFPFTNTWGSMVGLLTPFALMALADKRVGVNQRLVKLVLFASVVPIITSLNRGLWLSLGAGVLYAVFRSGSEGQRKVAARLAVLGAIGAALFYLTPLGDLVLARLSEGHSDEDRSELALAAINGGLERPIFGWGTTRDDPNLFAPIGTHGQIWNLIFAYGFVGLIGWLFATLRFFKESFSPKNSIGLWAHTVIGISIIQMLFYLQVPQQLFTLMAAVAVAVRSRDIDDVRIKTEPELVL